MLTIHISIPFFAHKLWVRTSLWYIFTSNQSYINRKNQKGIDSYFFLTVTEPKSSADCKDQKPWCQFADCNLSNVKENCPKKCNTCWRKIVRKLFCIWHLWLSFWLKDLMIIRIKKKVSLDINHIGIKRKMKNSIVSDLDIKSV